MGNYRNWIYMALIFVVVIIAGSIIYARLQKRRETRINKSSSLNRKSGKNRLIFFYRLFYATPGIRKIFDKVIDNTKSVFPSDTMSINKEATKIMLKTLGMSAAVIIITMSFAKGDMWYLLMGIACAIVIFYQNIHTVFQKKDFTLLMQLRDALSAIRHHYLSCMIVEDSIDASLDEVPYEIGLHLSKIYEILISPIMDEEIEEYTEMAPNRFLMLLLSICASCKEYSNGEDGFLKSLSYMKEELGQEIIKKNLIKSTFVSMQGICILPIFFLKPVEIWVAANMPEAADFYAGTFGRALMIGIFLAAFACFYIIDVLKESRRGEIIRHSIWSRIANFKGISTTLNKMVNKKYLYYLDLNEDLKEVGDQTGPKAFLAKQISFAVAAFVLVNSTVFITTMQQKLTMLDEYVAAFDNDIIPNKRYQETMERVAQDYVVRYKDIDPAKTDVDDLVRQMQTSGDISNEVYARLVAEEVLNELTVYKNTYYKWYVLLASILVAAIAYFVPRVYLKFRIEVSTMNKEEEVSQFQTLILILMNADGIKLDEILDWLDKFAYAFKASIEECILNLENGERKALTKMKDSEKNTSFQRFVECLLMIDETDIRTAFSELEIDRAYTLSDRQQKAEDTIHKRGTLGKFIVFIPLMATLFGYAAMPMAILALKSYFMMPTSI